MAVCFNLDSPLRMFGKPVVRDAATLANNQKNHAKVDHGLKEWHNGTAEFAKMFKTIEEQAKSKFLPQIQIDTPLLGMATKELGELSDKHHHIVTTPTTIGEDVTSDESSVDSSSLK